jgi:hypothetical protein
MENKRGGLRKGAGRKPTDNPKQTITLYVEKKKIWAFGNEEKLKSALYDFINSRQIAEIPSEVAHKPILLTEADISAPNGLNAVKSPVIASDEPLSFEKLKEDVVKRVSQYDAYINEINSATQVSQFEPMVREIEKDMSLTPQQKTKLKITAVEKSKEFDF